MSSIKPEQQQDFENERRREIVDVISVISTKMSMPLYLVFWLADWLYAPQHIWLFLGMRLTIIPISLLVNHNIKKSTSLKGVQGWAAFFIFWNALMITLMIATVGESSSIYYAGINLVGIAGISFIPWQWSFAAINLGLVYGPFVAFSVFKIFFQQQDWHGFAINSFFVLGTAVISMVIRLFNNRLRVKEFQYRTVLASELAVREKIVETKTQEAVNLKTLSRQFSPQIVHAISTGRLNIEERVHRAQITAIFIDIVNSTSRVVRLDKDAINSVISKFMEDTIPVLVKYDLTIDKFLGDGVLAFANDPVPHKDHVQRTVMAAFEIISRIKANQEFYLDHWLNELQIRVGVATGFANIGFYGKAEVYRTYTAIGPVMNLASRLCSVAAPNSVIVSNEAKKTLEATDPSYQFKQMGNLTLKGFEQDVIRAFEITGLPEAMTGLREASLEKCPSCGSYMHLDVDAQGIYVFQCRDCEGQASHPKAA